MAEQPFDSHAGDDGPHREDEPQREAEQPGGKLIPLRAIDAGSAVAFEEKTGGASYVDATGIEGTRRDVIPAHLTRARLPETVGEWLGKARFHFLYHGIRSPWHTLRLTWMAVAGAWNLRRRLWEWASLPLSPSRGWCGPDARTASRSSSPRSCRLRTRCRPRRSSPARSAP